MVVCLEREGTAVTLAKRKVFGVSSATRDAKHQRTAALVNSPSGWRQRYGVLSALICSS